MANRSASEIVADARQALDTAKLGLLDLESAEVRRRVPGAMNIAVFGRAVTNILQNLRSVAPTFDEWYADKVKVMRNDALLRYFYDLRSEILKRGTIPMGKKATVTFRSNEQLMELLGPPPPGPVAMVAVNQDGLSGWTIRLADGTDRFFAVSLPDGMSSVTFHIPKPPTIHLEQPLSTDNLAELAKLYCSFLTTLIDEAEAIFVTSRPA